MKRFIDATSEKFYPRLWADKLAAGFTTSYYPSGDKYHTLQTFVTLAMQQGMVWIGHNIAGFDEAEPGIYVPFPTNRLGGWLGVMATSHPWEAVQSSPGEPDLQVASALGQRVGLATLRWNR